MVTRVLSAGSGSLYFYQINELPVARTDLSCTLYCSPRRVHNALQHSQICLALLFIMSPNSEVHRNVEEDHVGAIEEALRAKAGAALSAGFADGFADQSLPAGPERP